MADTASSKRIAIGADHGGFPLKEHLRKRLADQGHTLIDCGTFDGATADYPKIAATVATKISDHSADVGIIIDGAGIGSCMTANKFPGVRAALCYDLSSAANSREHNDANVLTLGAGLIGTALAEQIVDLWLSKSCTVERHQKRVAMIGEIEDDLLSHGGKPSACGCQHGAPKMSDAGEKVQKVLEASGPVDLSQEDIERIASRILDMVGPAALAGQPCSCCGAT